MSKRANFLPDIRPTLDGMKGHNYALPDCLAFLWERLNENPELDFWKFAAITGDTVSQVYNRKPSTTCEYCVSGYLAGAEHIAYIFDNIGYEHTYVTSEQINADKETYLQKLKDYIDKSIPIIVKTTMADIPGWSSDVGTHCLIVGYDDDGKTLMILVEGDKPIKYDASGIIQMDWVFIGEKQRNVTMEEIYLNTIHKMTYWLTLPERDGMFFGAAAFRAWAEDIENGRYENENVHLWDNYGVYVCNLATSGGEPTYLFHKLVEINSQYTEYIKLGEKIQSLIPSETPTGGRTLDWIRLEELGGGMNVTREVMCDKDKRSKIAAVLRKRADHLDEVIQILKDVK